MSRPRVPAREKAPENWKAALAVGWARRPPNYPAGDLGGPLAGDPADALDVLDVLGILGPRDASGKWTISDKPLGARAGVHDPEGERDRRDAEKRRSAKEAGP